MKISEIYSFDIPQHVRMYHLWNTFLFDFNLFIVRCDNGRCQLVARQKSTGNWGQRHQQRHHQHYRVIQRDCHKWKCYLITLNLVFIDFWDISRLHILGGLLFKPTLNQNRHFWLLGPNFFHMVFLGPEITCSFTQFLLTPFFGPGSHKFCGNISHPYPGKSLNASAFLESAHSTAQWTVFCLTGWIWGLFGDGHLRRESAPNFCPRTTKFGSIVWVTQKSILMDQHTGSHKEIWINCQFWVLPKSLKNGLQI